MAYIVVGKFCDSLPFYRQEKQFARIGVQISRQDMANWSVAVFERLRPLRELMRLPSLTKGCPCFDAYEIGARVGQF